MLNENLNLTFVLIITLVVANIFTSTVGLLASTQMAKITAIPTRILAPIVIIFTLVGSFGTRKEIFDVFMAAGFGILGYLMKKTNFPRIPIVLGLVLGPIAESSFHTSMQFSSYNYTIFLTRPICILLIVGIIASFLLPLIKRKRVKRS